LLSAVEDKVRRKLGEIFAQYQAEMDVLQKTQRELIDGEKKITNIIGRLETDKVINTNNSETVDHDFEISNILSENWTKRLRH
jgi:ESCRT-I complex subunit TSG101